jgi:predicted Zn-dependent protease with MMP-like domain
MSSETSVANKLFRLVRIRYHALIIMDRPAFEILVQHSIRQLPRRFKQKLANISVEIEDRPSQKLLNDMGIRSGTLFGLYQGVPLTERAWNYGNMLPDRIVIYQQPIESVAASPEEIEKIVSDTVIHEIGHYFGFSDKELREIEAAKSREAQTHKK